MIKLVRKRPILHVTPTRNWMNDPNGLIYYRGEYHMFYQHYPYACEWGTMHWGHLVSPDLIHWEERAIALRPSVKSDCDGCFSGCAIEKDGKLYLYYTGVKYMEADPQKPHQLLNDELVCEQMMIISEDGKNFPEKNKRVIIPRLNDITFGSFNRTHDPKVWKGECGRYYMTFGSQYMENGENNYIGEMLIYQSEDALHWEYLNRYADRKLGTMWECPTLIRIDGQAVLFLSAMHIQPGMSYRDNTIYELVEYEEITGTVSKIPQTADQDSEGHLSFPDYGMDTYAPHTFEGPDGEIIMYEWIRMPKPQTDENWIGMMTLPRILHVKDHILYSDIHPCIRQLFCTEIPVQNADLEHPIRITGILDVSSLLDIGGCVITVQDGGVCLDRRRSFPPELQKECWVLHKSPVLKAPYRLEIYMDVCVIEVYINEGQCVMTNVLYEVENRIFSEGIKDLHCYIDSKQ